MHGWGRVPVLVACGVWLAAACGGRTSTLEADYIFGESGSGNQGGTPGRAGAGALAGRPGHAGTGSVGGRPSGGAPAGGASFGGRYPVAGYYAGGSAPVGGYGIAGYPYGGGYPAGGTFSFGGTYSFGGTVAVGGYPGGGFYYGGYGGVGPNDCQSCLRQACSPQVAQCFSDFGCLAIFGCMVANGCQGFQCYTPDQCQGVINQWGGPAGQSMNELLQTFACAFQAGCPCN